MLRELDGSRTLREALATVVDEEAPQRAGVAVTRRMLEVGFLDLVD